MKNKGLLFTISMVVLVTLIPTLISCAGNSPGVFEQILSVIPDTESNRAMVAINDYVRMQKQLQVDAPRKDATPEEQMTYVQDLYSLDGTGKLITFAATIGFINNNNSYLLNSLELMHNMEIGYWLIDQEVSAGWPPINMSIIKGRFNPENSQQALVESAKADPPNIETYDDNTIYSWGADNEINLGKRLTPPAYDMLGRGGRFVFQNDFTIRTNQTSIIKQFLDTQQGKQNSLAKVIEFDLIAKELSSYGAMSAYFSNQTQSFEITRDLLAASSKSKAEEIDKYLAQGPILLPYQTIGLGIAKDEKGLYGLVILVHADEQTATKNVSLLKQRIEETNSCLANVEWTTMFTDVSVTSRSRVLTAKLYGPDIGRNWLAWYFQHDPLVIHE
jgi:hypothetical protein